MKLSVEQSVLERIRLLCRCGVGLEGIASPLCDAVQQLTSADAVALFWLDASESVIGFCFDRAPDDLKELYVTHYDELFSPTGGNFINNWILKSDRSIGTALEVPNEYFECANFRLLIKPSGYYWPFDCRVIIDGATRATMFLYNPKNRPFDDSYVATMKPVQRLMRQAILGEKSLPRWRSVSQTECSLLTDGAGQQIIAASPSMRELFSRCQMLLLDKTVVGSTSRAPAFALILAARLQIESSATMTFSVVGGRLVVNAHVIDRLDNAQPMIAMQLHLEESVDVLIVRYICDLPLTPLQREIALFAVQNGKRAACESELGISNESLKKHLAHIYSQLGLHGWDDIRSKICTDLSVSY